MCLSEFNKLNTHTDPRPPARLQLQLAVFIINLSSGSSFIHAT